MCYLLKYQYNVQVILLVRVKNSSLMYQTVVWITQLALIWYGISVDLHQWFDDNCFPLGKLPSKADL